MAKRSDHARILVVVEAAREHFLCESDEVWRLTQVPLLVRPEGPGLAHASLDFVDDEVDSQLFSDILKTLRELSGDLVIASFTHDRFDNDGADF